MRIQEEVQAHADETALAFARDSGFPRMLHLCTILREAAAEVRMDVESQRTLLDEIRNGFHSDYLLGSS
jgi:hypothetical protein